MTEYKTHDLKVWGSNPPVFYLFMLQSRLIAHDVFRLQDLTMHKQITLTNEKTDSHFWNRGNELQLTGSKKDITDLRKMTASWIHPFSTERQDIIEKDNTVA